MLACLEDTLSASDRRGEMQDGLPPRGFQLSRHTKTGPWPCVSASGQAGSVCAEIVSCLFKPITIPIAQVDEHTVPTSNLKVCWIGLSERKSARIGNMLFHFGLRLPTCVGTDQKVARFPIHFAALATWWPGSARTATTWNGIVPARRVWSLIGSATHLPLKAGLG